jgi:hypothetical protein
MRRKLIAIALAAGALLATAPAAHAGTRVGDQPDGTRVGVSLDGTRVG